MFLDRARCWLPMHLVKPFQHNNTESSVHATMDPDSNPSISSLCHFCCSLLTYDDPNLSIDLPSERSHHPTWKVLVLSSQTCQLCRSIASWWRARTLIQEVQAATNSSKDDYQVKVITLATRQMPSGVVWGYHEARLRSTYTPRSWASYFTTISNEISSVDASPGKRHMTAPSPSSPNDLDHKAKVIRSYLQQCRSSDTHTDCTPAPFVPFRLVTVGMDGKPSRLVTRAELDTIVEYTTLSHCWGDSRPLCTTTNKIVQFSKEVPSMDIPKTYSEAIYITKACGIPYIWIDALCIVQDDEDEWQMQASQMSQIYRGSQLTICATQSSDSTQGCFLSNNQGLREGEQFFLARSVNCPDKNIFVRAYQHDIRSRATTSSSINVLSTRGWTLQEQLLSIRSVACMQPELHWQCRAYYQTQCGLIFKPTQMLDGHPPLHITSLSHDLLSSRSKISHAWRAIAEDYSNRDLTYSRDKCPALVGIMRYFASLSKYTFILGLWRETFSRDLSWMRLANRQSTPSLLNLPSWSWLSLSGAIAYDFWRWPGQSAEERNSDITDHLQLLDFEVNWNGLPDTSEVQSAYVEVSGPVCEIPIRPFAAGDNHNPPYFQVFGEELDYISKTKIPWRCAGQFDTENIKAEGVYFCILLSTEKCDVGNFTVSELFLILGSVGPPSDRTYKRLGIARLSGEAPSFDLEKVQTLRLI